MLGVRTLQTSEDPAADRATVVLHGVRRIEGGTVLYYSAGYEGAGDAMGLAEASGTADRWSDQRSDEVSLDLAADVLFAFDSAELGPQAQERIAGVAATINERAAGGAIAVVGHTDSEGSEAYNDELSLERAQAVAAALEPLLEVPDAALAVEGLGEREPVADNETEEGRAQNRRVSVVFTPGEAS